MEPQRNTTTTATRTILVLGLAALCLMAAVPAASADPARVYSRDESTPWGPATCYYLHASHQEPDRKLFCLV